MSFNRSGIYPKNHFSVTLLSNGSADIYPHSSLTHFTNQFPKKIKLDPLLDHYVALQEIGVDLQTQNIPSSNYSLPSIFLFNYYAQFCKNLTNNFIDYPGEQYFISRESGVYIHNFPLTLTHRLITLDIIESLITNYFHHSKYFFKDSKRIYI